MVTTTTIEQITNEGRLLTLLNQREIGIRRGLIVSGDAATGKTTAIKQLGRFHEIRTRARFPHSDCPAQSISLMVASIRRAPEPHNIGETADLRPLARVSTRSG